MDAGGALRLVVLRAIWGGSFALLRIAVPELGAEPTIQIRLVLAAAFLAALAALRAHRVAWRRDRWHFLILGTGNSALPFLLFAYAAQHVPAAMLAVFNSLAPIFAALFGRLTLGEALSRGAALGLALGVVGVGLLAGETALAGVATPEPWPHIAALAAGLAAPALYGAAGIYLKARPVRTAAFDNALGSMLAASFVMLPAVALWPSPLPTQAPPWLAVLALGLVCTGFAYVLNFRLIADLGPVRAMTVTFLIPLFGAFWGLLLGEGLTLGFALGAPLILAGTALAAGMRRT